MGSSLAITLFILAIAGTFFILPSKVKCFVKNIYVDLIIRRSLYVLGFYLMTLNSAIMATIALFAGLNLTREMFVYMIIFGWAGYAAMVYLVVKTMFDLFGMHKETKRAERTGDYD